MDQLNEAVGCDPSSLGSSQVEMISKILKSKLISDWSLCKSHPLLVRLGETVTNGSEKEAVESLELLAYLSRNENNADPLSYMMEIYGEGIEKFTAKHAELDGHRNTLNDEIYRNLLILLMGMSNYNLRASQILELTDGKLSTAFAAVSAVLRGPFGEASLEELLQGDRTYWESNLQITGCAIKVLCDFTSCDAYFQSADARDYQSIDISDLNKEFTNNIIKITKMLLQLPVIDLTTVLLDEWFQVVKKRDSNMGSLLKICGTSPGSLAPQSEISRVVSEYLEAGVTGILTMVSNLLSYTTEWSARLRKHISSHTILIQNLILPYAKFLTTTIEARASAEQISGTLPRFVKQLLYIIKVTSFVTFRVRVFRPWFRNHNFTCEILKSKVLRESNLWVDIVAMVARLNVNIDVADDSHSNSRDVVNLFKSVFESLQESEKIQVSRRLVSPVEIMYPVNKLSVTYRELSYYWEHAVLQPVENVPSEIMFDTPSTDSLDQPSRDTDSSPNDADSEGRRISFKFDFKPGEAGPTIYNTRKQHPGSMRSYYCRGKLKTGFIRGRGRSAHRAYQSNKHHNKQRLVLERRWKLLRAKRRKSIAEDDDDDDGLCSPFNFTPPTTEEIDKIEKTHMTIAADQIPTSSVESKPTNQSPTADVPDEDKVLEVSTAKIRATLIQAAAPTAERPKPPEWTRIQQTNCFGLGEKAETVDAPVLIYKPTKLTPLDHPKGLEMNSFFGDKKTKIEDKTPSGTRILWQPSSDPKDDGDPRDEAEIPSSFLCSLTHQLLACPVISPHGDAYEKSVIIEWILRNGNICPRTSKPLKKEDLVPDNDLRRAIEEYRLKQRIVSVM